LTKLAENYLYISFPVTLADLTFAFAPLVTLFGAVSTKSKACKAFRKKSEARVRQTDTDLYKQTDGGSGCNT